MKKILLFLILILQASCFAQVMYLAKDTFIPVYPSKSLSSSVLEEGDTFYFIVPSDLWIEEYKIIPKNSIVKGIVTLHKMPVTGINAAMEIDAVEIAFPDGNRYSVKGKIAYKGETRIGGDLTPPASYNKSLHPMKGEYFNGVLAQYVPSGEYEFGQHITILTGELLQVVLEEDFTPY
ncbi:MAG: hypothetical protein LUE64_06460 [Candidatus Gastranaerophilales bacterium]|nr:hypothetical protein [Candidatus Gastranaerophilales bacterium]